MSKREHKLNPDIGCADFPLKILSYLVIEI
jgi:hypothetical protein